MGSLSEGQKLLREAIRKLLAEGNGWATIGQMSLDITFELSRNHETTRPRSTNEAGG